MIAIVGGTIVELDPPRVERADVLVEGARIRQIGGEIPSGVSRLDAQRCIVTPAFAVGHTHLYSTRLACGMPPPEVAPASFPEILAARVWWKLDRALDHELVAVSALVGAAEAAKRGVTCVIDHHSSPSAIGGSLDRIAAALHQVGVRGVLCYETSDRDGKAARDAGLAENARFACGRAGDRASHIRAMTGAHAPFTLEDDTLDALADLSARRYGAPIHVATPPGRLHRSRRRRPPRDDARRAPLAANGGPIARGQSSRTPSTSAPSDRRSPRRRHGALDRCTNARSNMNNAVGLASASEGVVSRSGPTGSAPT